MRAGIHQRKWEMDSLASVLKLGREYYAATGDAAPFGARWRQAVATIVATYRAMQAPLDPRNFTSANYTFQTLTHEPKDTSAHGIGRSETSARSHRVAGILLPRVTGSEADLATVAQQSSLDGHDQDVIPALR